MTVNDQIEDEKLQYDIARQAAKMLALSSGSINECEYLTGEEILPSNQKLLMIRLKMKNYSMILLDKLQKC